MLLNCKRIRPELKPVVEPLSLTPNSISVSALARPVLQLPAIEQSGMVHLRTTVLNLSALGTAETSSQLLSCDSAGTMSHIRVQPAGRPIYLQLTMSPQVCPSRNSDRLGLAS